MCGNYVEACILTYGPITRLAAKVAERIMSETGSPAEVYSVHTLKPLDRAGITGILQTYDKVVVIEEHSEHGGLSSQVKEIAWDSRASLVRSVNDPPLALYTFALRDEFIHAFGSQEDLWAAHGLTVDAICEAL